MTPRLCTPTIEWSCPISDNPGPLRALCDAFFFVAQVARHDALLATHPKIVTRGNKRFLAVRWGGTFLSDRHRQKLQTLDPRFHKCPPLKKGDDGMTGCIEE